MVSDAKILIVVCGGGVGGVGVVVRHNSTLGRHLLLDQAGLLPHTIGIHTLAAVIVRDISSSHLKTHLHLAVITN